MKRLKIYINIYKYIYIYILYIYIYIAACKQINGKNARSHIAKEHCESFIRNKNTKSVKKSEIITYQPKILKSPTLLI